MCVLVLSTAGVVACKKTLNPGAYDGGVSSTVALASGATSVGVPTIDSSNAVAAESSEPLAPLEEGKARASTGSAAATKPKGDPPECVEARKQCSNPAVGRNRAIEKSCNDARFACFNKGGHL